METSFLEYVVEDYIDNDAKNGEASYNPDKENTPSPFPSSMLSSFSINYCEQQFDLTNRVKFPRIKNSLTYIK